MPDELFEDVASDNMGNAPNENDDNQLKEPYRKTLEQWKLRFKDFQSTMQDNRKSQEVNYKYYDAEQYTPEEKEKLKDRKQPDIVINRFRVAINGILGVVSRSRSDPRALPRTPNDAASADVATDCLRYVAQRNRFKYEKVASLKDYLLGGCCAMLVGVTEDLDVDLIPIRWEEFFYDPRSRRPDFKDARYMGFAKWLYADDVKGLLEEAGMEGSRVDDLMTGGSMAGRTGNGVDDTFDDRPIDQGWIDSKHKRLMVIEVYERCKGEWVRAVIWEGGIIKQEISPYLDQYGRSTNPIEAQSCYVDIDNNRIGYGTDLRDIQDEINKRRQKALWEISANQIQASDPSAIEVSADEARVEAARPDGVIPFGWQVVKAADRSAANMALLNEAKNEMERFSPNPAMLGRQGSDTSGRALLARQQAGLVELAVVLDQFEDWELRIYKQIWMRCKQWWDEPRWIRVTENLDDPRFVAINQPIMEVPELDEQGQPVIGSDGQPVMRAATEGGEFGYQNSLAEMDVDIMIDTAPETATIMQEQLTELRSIVSSNPNYAAEVPFELFIEMTNMPRKREFIQKVKEQRAAAQEAQQAQMQAQMQQAQMELEAKVQKMLADAGLSTAKAEAAIRGADQGDIRTAVQADKALSQMGTDEARANMEGARTTADILQMAQEPAAGDTGDTGGGDQ